MTEATSQRCMALMEAQSRNARMHWNMIRNPVGTNPSADQSVASARMLSTIAVALEGIPGIALRHDSDETRRALENQCLTAMDMISRMRVMEGWHPEGSSVRDPHGHAYCIRRSWRELCDLIARNAGVEPVYGVLDERSPVQAGHGVPPEFGAILRRSLGRFGLKPNLEEDYVLLRWNTLLEQAARSGTDRH